MIERSLQTILIVDDDELDRVFVSSCIVGAYTVIETKSIVEAKAILELITPACVLLDYRIPGEDSLSFIAELTEEYEYPVIMLTGEGEEQIAVDAMKRGARDYLVKDSLEKDELLSSISEAINYASMVREGRRRQEELESFAFVAAHDLNNPLSTIRNAASILRREVGDSPSERVDEIFDILERGCQRMQTLIQDLLGYSKVGRDTSSFENISLNELASQVLADLKSLIEDSGTTITVNELPEVFGDSTGLRQLFQNLITNSIKYSKTDPEISISAISEDGGWKLSFKDNGIGIAPEFHSKIFESFTRTHEKDGVIGSGLGLATCKRVAEQHSGKIWVDSEPGKGTNFLIFIPEFSQTSY